MSRCFPFPPPGYEKKATIDDVNLLKKDKLKAKKHKKEKKDKEKREDKDRKEKEKSDGKHRDTKVRKEKSNGRKDKEKEKDRDKTNTSQEKKIPAQVESCNGDHKPNYREKERVRDQNITSNEKRQITPFGGHIGEKPVEKFNKGAMDKFVLDLCNRIKDEGKGSASESMERSYFTGRTNHDRMVKNENGIFPVEMEKKNDRRVDDIRKMEGQGVRVGEEISASRPNTLVQNIVGKEKIESKGVNISGGFQNRAEEIPKINVSTVVQNIVGKEKTETGVNTNGWFSSRVEEFPRISEKITEPGDKNHKKEGEDKRGSKRKDKDKEKKSHGKDKEREKEKKKEGKAKEKNAQKINDHDEVEDGIKNGHVVRQNIKLPQLVPGGNKNGRVVSQNVKLSPLVPDDLRNLAPDGNRSLTVGPNMKLPHHVPRVDMNLILDQNMKLQPFIPEGYRTPAVDLNFEKRKDLEVNGFLHETNSVPNKKLRPTPYPSIENGRKLEPCQAPVLHTPDRKVPPPNNLIKVNNSEHKVNGKIEVQPSSISVKNPSSLPSSSRNKADQNAQAPVVKQPHPDTEYLSRVLSVPKIEEITDFNDEEWLFNNKDRVSLSAGPITEASETPRVWDKAMQIESAEVCALPYVIPY